MNTRQTKALRDLANAAAEGQLTLPPPVAEVLATADRVRTAAALADVGVYDLEVGLWAAHDPVVAAPDPAAAATAAVEAVLDDERAHRVRYLASAVLDGAAEAAQLAALQAVQQQAAAIVTGHLAPALAATLDAVRAALPGLGGRDPSRAAMYGAPAKVVAAFEALERATGRYQVLRSCQAGLVLLGYRPKPRVEVDDTGQRRQVNDTDGWCLTARDAYYGAWPDRGGSSGFAEAPAPWPSDPVGGLVWQVAHGVPLWCPTIDEQNRAYQAVVAQLRGEYQAAAAKANRRGGARRPRAAVTSG